MTCGTHTDKRFCRCPDESRDRLVKLGIITPTERRVFDEPTLRMDYWGHRAAMRSIARPEYDEDRLFDLAYWWSERR